MNGIFFCLLSVSFVFTAYANTYNTLLEESLAKSNFVASKKNVNTYNAMIEEARRPKGLKKEKRIVTNSYYDSIVNDAKELRWAFPCTLSVFLEHESFDDNGCKVSLSDSLFGAGTTIKDVFLLARLSYDDKLQIHPTGYAGIPKFGDSIDEQYLALLAPVKLSLSLDQKSTGCSVGGLYRYKLFQEKSHYLVFGFDVPLSVQNRSINLMFQDGSLYHHGYTANVTVREDTITQFFKDFSSVEDFFIRAVLEPKGIDFKANQQKVGIGDISLFTIFESGPYNVGVGLLDVDIDSFQLGCNIAFPSATKSSSGTFWGVEFGSGAGYQFTPFGALNLKTNSAYVNPFFTGGAELNSSFLSGKAGGIRLSRTVVQEQEGKLRDNPDVVLPVFREYRALPFEEVDSTIALFADRSIDDATITIGKRLFFGVGNYVYHLFKRDVRLGLFYTFSKKFSDSIVTPSEFDTSSFAGTKVSVSHRVGWSLAYKFEKEVDASIGSQHIVAGRNVPQQHEFFLSLAIAF